MHNEKKDNQKACLQTKMACIYIDNITCKRNSKIITSSRNHRLHYYNNQAQVQLKRNVFPTKTGSTTQLETKHKPTQAGTE